MVLIARNTINIDAKGLPRGKNQQTNIGIRPEPTGQGIRLPLEIIPASETSPAFSGKGKKIPC
ncbi:hypothetical protein X474_04110 [Dethiosulfatarculus sandiegensis]|uniref:Uncharacterized protein n=1 Tax=Dethiosulfatarculus sandiegensis TaxID=1429043 RepID=A0A0D2GLA0_9BACT|nr:hypothetical protein X474_04110 [Dethiosulfatarculus sandiegensis]